MMLGRQKSNFAYIFSNGVDGGAIHWDREYRRKRYFKRWLCEYAAFEIVVCRTSNQPRPQRKIEARDIVLGSSTLQAVVEAVGVGKIVAGHCVNSQEAEMTIRVLEYSNI